MRYRKQTDSGDYQFGHSASDMWRDQPEAVGQAVRTRLLLYAGEWYLDLTEGTPWGGFPFNQSVVQQGKILGANTAQTRDLALRQRILETEGVQGLTEWSSSFDPNTRVYLVNAIIDTIYGGQVGVSGQITMSGVFTLGVSSLDGTVGLG